MVPDSELVARILAGEAGGWQEWNRRFHPVLTRIAYREFRLTPEDTEDLLQNLALSLVMSDGRLLQAYRGQARLQSWLCTMWRHRCVDLKRRSVAGRSTSPSATLERRSDPTEGLCLARQALALASARDRRLLQMHFILGLSHKEIAARFEISENAVGPALDRAKRRLKKIIAAPCTKSGVARAYMVEGFK
jgi:RNA polymerase sigma factor (sigma-70 family)